MYTYILADDEPLIRRGMKKKMESLQEEISCVGEASNGRQVLKLLEEKNPDFLITDMKMPLMDGSELLPILTERYPSLQVIVISGYKDFEYSRQALRANAVDYLLKPVNSGDLVKAVRNVMDRLDQLREGQFSASEDPDVQERENYLHDVQILTNMVLGYRTSDTEILSEKLRFTDQYHQILLITMHSAEPFRQDRMVDFVERSGFGDLALFLQHTQTDNLGFLVLFCPEKRALSAKNLALQVVESLSKLYASIPQDVSFGVSHAYDSLLNLHEAFLESVNALNQKRPEERNGCYFYKPDRPMVTVNWDKEDELLFVIEAGFKERIPGLVEDLFLCFEEYDRITIFDMKQFCRQLMGKVREMASRYFEQVHADDISVNMQNSINTMFSAGELQQYFLRMFLNMSEAISADSLYSSGNVAENIKQYVDMNFQKALTVEFIASLFMLNRNYCSTVFRERYGVTLINYINEVRVEKAKVLLRDSDKKMYQVAAAVGYDNVKYFFRIFKKITHQTPDAYRKLISH